jgi:hypothetical protein
MIFIPLIISLYFFYHYTENQKKFRKFESENKIEVAQTYKFEADSDRRFMILSIITFFILLLL